MSCRSASLLATLCAVVLPFPAAAQTMSAEGVLERSDAGDGCNQDLTHQITDNCTGFPVYLRSFGPDLDSFLCQHVRVIGWDVGVECTILQVESVEPVAPACPLQVLYLTVHESNLTWIDWWRTPCAETYDLIRGELPGPAEAGGTVDLGAVTCRENDFPATNTFSEERDIDVPPLGRSFFYLARGYGGPIGDTSYGFSSSGAERIPSSGDCPEAP
jgi:hypothetical protein